MESSCWIPRSQCPSPSTRSQLLLLKWNKRKWNKSLHQSRLRWRPNLPFQRPLSSIGKSRTQTIVELLKSNGPMEKERLFRTVSGGFDEE